MPRQVIHELDEPSTIWSTVSRFAGLGCILLFIAIISVPFFPRFRSYRQLNEEGRGVAAHRDALRNQLEDKEAELRMIDTDPQYLELKARDHLDLYKEGEVVFRFEAGK
jgi:hypothetical protein